MSKSKINLISTLFEKVDANTIKTSSTFEDSFSAIKNNLIIFGGKIQKEDINSGEVVASFRYGINFFGIIIQIKMKKESDYIIAEIKGHFKDAIDQSAAKNKAQDLVERLTGGDVQIQLSNKDKLLKYWKKQNKLGKTWIVINIIGVLSFLIIYLIMEPLLRFNNPSLYKCIDRAKDSAAWAQSMHSAALSITDSKGNPDPNIDRNFVFTSEADIKKCHLKYD